MLHGWSASALTAPNTDILCGNTVTSRVAGAKDAGTIVVMSRFARLVSVAAFVLAYLSQPLALDACAVSCEAARAARTPGVAAPCHHTTSCASQISQPASPSSTVGNQT